MKAVEKIAESFLTTVLILVVLLYSFNFNPQKSTDTHQDSPKLKTHYSSLPKPLSQGTPIWALLEEQQEEEEETDGDDDIIVENEIQIHHEDVSYSGEFIHYTNFIQIESKFGFSGTSPPLNRV